MDEGGFDDITKKSKKSSGFDNARDFSFRYKESSFSPPIKNSVLKNQVSTLPSLIP